MPRAVRIQSDGRPHAGALAYFYETGTLNDKDVFTDSTLVTPFTQPVQADSEGQFPPIYLDETQSYHLILKTASGLQIDNIDPYVSVSVPDALTQDDIAELLNPLTVAETSAAVITSSKVRLPGDIRRYGAVSDGTTDCAAALQDAIEVSQQTTNPHDPGVYVPPSQLGWHVSSGLFTVNGAPFRIYGDNAYYSTLIFDADVDALTITDMTQYQGVSIENVGFIQSVASTNRGIHFKNSSYCRMVGCIVQGFLINVHFDPATNAPQSCFSCSMEDCTIVGALAGGVNILAWAQTNNLTLRNVTAGGTAGVGVQVIDSIGFSWFGGDCEAVAGAVALDFDSTASLAAGHIVQGVDFEACSCASGIIRIGHTDNVVGVSILSNNFSNAGSSEYLVNPENCTNLTFLGNALNTGVNSGEWIHTTGTTLTNLITDGAISTDAFSVGGTLALDPLNIAKTGRLVEALIGVTYSASMTIDAALGNCFAITISDGSAFTINNPTNPRKGQTIEVWLINGAGAPHGTITWGGGFKMSGALAAIADTKNRFIRFRYNGTSWYESFRSAADIAN